MPFPTTTVVDSFSRADAASLGANWLGALGDPNLKIVTTAAAGSTAGAANFSANTYAPGGANAVYPASQEAFVTVSTADATASAENVGIYLRLRNPQTFATATGYEAFATKTNVGMFRLSTGGVYTQIGPLPTLTLSSGDLFGFQIIGNVLSIWYGPAGVWQATPFMTATDDAFSGSGSIALEVTNNVARLRNFGGGGVPVSPPISTGNCFYSQNR